jgi:hypothetical protein
MKRVLQLAAVGAVALTLAACTPQPEPAPPSYEEVREEATDAMQLIVNVLPEGLEVEDLSTDPFACELTGDTVLSGSGLFYTGRWIIHPEGDFDGQAFIDELPAKLGDDFVVDDTAVEVSYPVVALKPTAAPEVLIDVTANTPDEEPFIGISAISRCGATPSPKP